MVKQTNQKTPDDTTSSHLLVSRARNSRRKEITLSRLRIDHTRLTHSYLLNRYLLSGPTSPRYEAEHLITSHFFSCKQLQSLCTFHNVQSYFPLALRNNSEHSHGAPPVSESHKILQSHKIPSIMITAELFFSRELSLNEERREKQIENME